MNVPEALFPTYDRELAAALRVCIALGTAIPLRTFYAKWERYLDFQRHPSTWDAEYWTVIVHKLTAAHPATSDLAEESIKWLKAHGYHAPLGTLLTVPADEGKE